MSKTKPSPRNDDSKAIGARLRVEREAQAMTLGDLAAAVGCSINKLRWHEAGSRMFRADTLAQAARILRLDPQDLMVPHYAAQQDDVTLRQALGRRMQSERALAGKQRHECVTGTHIPVYELAAHETGVRSLRIDQLVRIAAKLGIEPSRLIALGAEGASA